MTDVTAVPRVLLRARRPRLPALRVGPASAGSSAGPLFDPGFWIAVGWMVVIVLLAAVRRPVAAEAVRRRRRPACWSSRWLRPDLFSAHPLGTDKQGLDLLGQVIYGARVSLVIGVGALVIAMSIGSTIGLAAGYYRGKLDGVRRPDRRRACSPSRRSSCCSAMVAVLDPSTLNIMLALAILGIPTYIRLPRANTMVFAQREFVLASQGARCQAASDHLPRAAAERGRCRCCRSRSS